jgi:hypothetical protein
MTTTETTGEAKARRLRERAVEAEHQEYVAKLIKHNGGFDYVGRVLVQMVESGRIDDGILPDHIRIKIGNQISESDELKVWRLAHGYDA